MVTRVMGSTVVLALRAACSGKQATSDAPRPSAAGEAQGAPGLLPPDTVEPGGSGPAYPGHGFRVHEWGTNTIVVGSDGAMQRGMHHEEEDLPSFVYDRRRQEVARPADVKMETPVTYFYSDKPLRAAATVRFPRGVLTQWYPAVTTYWPPVFQGKGDPVFDPQYPFTSAACREQLARVEDGSLTWSQLDVLPRDARAALPDAPLTRFTWSHARDVAANPLRLTTASGAVQDERFLFYRGLGSFPLNVKITAQPGAAGDDGGLALANQDAREPIGAVFVLRVEADKAAFVVRPAGIAPGATLLETAPAATQPLDDYAQALAKAMVVELDRAGLYHDESVAMVKTWARQWFRTPGVRVLYLAPRAWTDAQIPLDVTPAPEEMVRVMVIRVEALTRRLEQADVAAVAKLGGDAASRSAARAHFTSLGRFAEPRLRRAIAIAPDAPLAANELLDELAGVDARMRTGE